MRRVLLTLLVVGLGIVACGRPDASGSVSLTIPVPRQPQPTPVDPPYPADDPLPQPSALAPLSFEDFARRTFYDADTNHNNRLTKSELQNSSYLSVLAADYRWGLGNLRGWDYPTFEAALRRVVGDNPDLPRFPVPAIPDRAPVLLVQGWGEPSYYLMYGIDRHLRKQGWQVYGINLFPNVTFSDSQAKKVIAKIQQIFRETGARKVNLVCHSFGGIISRQVIQEMGGDAYVDHYVSVATPHFGTDWCGVIPGGACVDMHHGSGLLTRLNRKALNPSVKWHCIYTKTDEIVLPPSSAILPGATVYPPVPHCEHGLILWHPKTYGYIDQALAT